MNELIKRLKREVKVAEKDCLNMDCVSWGSEHGILMSYNDAKKVIALKEWKDFAMNVFKDIDLQELGKEMNLQPGKDIAKKILPYIKKLKADKQITIN